MLKAGAAVIANVPAYKWELFFYNITANTPSISNIRWTAGRSKLSLVVTIVKPPSKTVNQLECKMTGSTEKQVKLSLTIASAILTF